MLVAYDENKNRIYANSEERITECYCPECGEKLIHKKGAINIPYFSHKVKTDCLYGKDKDYKSEWHIRMQALFPLDSVEVRFKDEETRELNYIADVFLKESNTVIEFQHSPIDANSFVDRTIFHIKAGRRVVWIFDESKPGRLIQSDYMSRKWPYDKHEYEWPRSPRKVIDLIIQKREVLDGIIDFSVCVYLGESPNTVHRIIWQDLGFKYIMTSVHNIELGAEMNPDDFFFNERHWLEQSPWKEEIEKRREEAKAKAEARKIALGTSIVKRTKRRNIRL